MPKINNEIKVEATHSTEDRKKSKGNGGGGGRNKKKRQTDLLETQLHKSCNVKGKAWETMYV
jgi:phage FluMu protein Com